MDAVGGTAAAGSTRARAGARAWARRYAGCWRDPSSAPPRVVRLLHLRDGGRLVFGDLFFNDERATGVGTPAAFATFGVGFAVRPLGGFLFGTWATASDAARR